MNSRPCSLDTFRSVGISAGRDYYMELGAEKTRAQGSGNKYGEGNYAPESRI